MTALDRDITRIFPEGIPLFYRAVAANTEIHKGAALSLDAAGYVVPLAAGRTFVGFARTRADNTGGASGDVSVTAQSEGRVLLDVDDVAATDVGRAVYAVDDATFNIAWSAGAVLIGTVESVEETGTVVRFRASSPIAVPTNSTGGVVATALVDVGAAHDQAKINANFATLHAALSALIARI